MTREEAIMVLKNEQPHCGKKALFPEEKKYEAFNIAIEALEQEPCEDAISRQAVLDTISETWRHICCVARRRKPTKGEEAVYSDIRETVKQVPSVTPKQRWIPVSERLPEESGEYLVSVVDGLYEKEDYKAVGVAWFAHQKDYAIARSEWRELAIGEKVVAWMPLPEPYRESEGEE